MRSISASLIALSSIASLASAAPFSIDPNQTNGFPTPNPDQLNKIEQAAHGVLPIAAPNAPPAKFSQDTLTSLRFIEFNENFEVAFFTSLINNITNNVDGFKFNNGTKKQNLLDNLIAIQAQEELHALNAANALKSQGANPIQPCKYVFPTNNTEDAIALASTFTDVVLATLPDIQTGFATNNDAALIRGVGSVIGQEGEQNGFFREYAKAKKIPSALPFLTAGTRLFAFSALNQNFVVNGSCPNIGDINIKPITTALTVPPVVKPQSTNIPFSFIVPNVPDSWKGTKGDWSNSPLQLVYVNQQNVPVVEKLQNVVPSQNPDGQIVINFDALFPFDGTKFGNGLTIAAVTNSAMNLSNVVDVSNAAIAGPGLIEVN